MRHPTKACKHSLAAVIQPNELIRAMSEWTNWCQACKSLIGGEPVHVKALAYVRNLSLVD